MKVLRAIGGVFLCVVFLGVFLRVPHLLACLTAAGYSEEDKESSVNLALSFDRLEQAHERVSLEKAYLEAKSRGTLEEFRTTQASLKEIREAEVRAKAERDYKLEVEEKRKQKDEAVTESIIAAVVLLCMLILPAVLLTKPVDPARV